MSFDPIGSVNTSTALLGSGLDLRQDTLGAKRIHGSTSNPPQIPTAVLILVSAVIFVTAVAIYDVIRNYINTAFIQKAIENNKLYSQEEKEKILISNNTTVAASIGFAVTCAVIALIVLPIVFYKYT